jgi:hypothetical protein
MLHKVMLATMEWSLDTYTVVMSVSAIVGLIALAVFITSLLMMIRDRRAAKRTRHRG